jgi:hypothetical protein
LPFSITAFYQNRTQKKQKGVRSFSQLAATKKHCEFSLIPSMSLSCFLRPAVKSHQKTLVKMKKINFKETALEGQGKDAVEL